MVTGASGFIGLNFVIDWLEKNKEEVISLDLLNYSKNIRDLNSLTSNPKHHFVKGDIANRKLVLRLLRDYKIRAIINFAAETHVDHSIVNASSFIQTNISGLFDLLESARIYWDSLYGEIKENFRFLHISTDEVYGALDFSEAAFTEMHAFLPNNPYSASKASGDHLLRAWHKTYGLPILNTHCSNNYGPYQFPEKFIPLCIKNAINSLPIPVYGNGKQLRDWVYVKDHCNAIYKVLEHGMVGESYNIGSSIERTNIQVAQDLCLILDELKPLENGNSYSELITFVKDRPGHDKRYVVDISKIKQNVGWAPQVSFEFGMRKTVAWYLEHLDWVNSVANKEPKKIY